MTTTFTDTGRARWGAAVLALAPVMLMAGFLYHPFIARPAADPEAAGAAAASDPTRWAITHLTVAVASALLVLAFLAVRKGLHEAGEERFSAPALPFVVVGSVLYAVLAGMEFAPMVAAETGGDVTAAQAALQPWFVPVFVTAAITFGLGALGFARAVAHSGVLASGTNRIVVAALVIVALSRFVPLGVVQFHVQGVAAILALWPLARWRWGAAAGRGAQQPRPATAS